MNQNYFFWLGFALSLGLLLALAEDLEVVFDGLSALEAEVFAFAV